MPTRWGNGRGPSTCLPSYQELGRAFPDPDGGDHTLQHPGCWLLCTMGTLGILLLLMGLLLSPAEAQKGKALTSGLGGGRRGWGMGSDMGSPPPHLMRNQGP